MRREATMGWILGALLLAAACQHARSGHPGAHDARTVASGVASAAPSAAPHPAGAKQAPTAPPIPASPAQLTATYERHLAARDDLDYAALVQELGLVRRGPAELGFDPTQTQHYDTIEAALQMTSRERQLFTEQGFVGVDHGQPYSMGSAYYAIYTRDLPVLVTTDSILHALHRTYDALLRELEAELLTVSLADVLAATHAAIEPQARDASDPRVRTALADADLYLTVARNLLAGAGAPAPGEPPNPELPPHLQGADAWDGTLLVPSLLDQDAPALELLRKVAALEVELPHSAPCTALYGGQRCVDYSQFVPRGHYTKSIPLKRYFRAMMWLGRADLGFNLSAPEAGHALRVQVERETRAAATLAVLVAEARRTPQLEAMSDLIDLMVGRADSATLTQLTAALAAERVGAPRDLADPARLAAVVATLAQRGGARQQIRSQVLESSPGGTTTVTPPDLVQVFGQRFVVDSMVLSRVVFDSIVYRKKKQERMLPSGLDVMAALGNDEAVALLEPELAAHGYSDNLLALRRTIEEHAPSLFTESFYGRWLGALRELDEVPAAARFPRAMRSRAWQHKALQTQLASWAELRHDTVLYAKQSYTASTLCEYPAGYVEPYPKLYAAVADLATEGARRLGRVPVVHDDPQVVLAMGHRKQRYVAFLERFAATMTRLEKLAQKELAGAPFTQDERTFLKQTIDVRGGGSGPPRYDGWYPSLIFGGEPALWEPTVADVHTSPGPVGRGTLEVAVGNVGFLVVAVDNDEHRATYVGPIYSYYELVVDPAQRLDDDAWQGRLRQHQAPPRPAFTESFQAPERQRRL